MPQLDYTVDLTKDEAVLLLEMVTKSAVQGPQAKILASLYEKAEHAVKYYGDQQP